MSFVQSFYPLLIGLICIYLTNIYATKLEGVLYFLLYLTTCLYVNFTTNDKPYEFIFEIGVCIGCLLIFFFKNLYLAGMLKSFNEWKKNQQITKYYKMHIDNLHLKSISLMDDKIVMYNKAFYDSLNTSKISIEGINCTDYFNEFILLSNNDQDHETCLADIVTKFKLKEIDLYSLSFIPCGTFTNKERKNFYTISMRKFILPNEKILIDILIDDFTEIKQAENLKTETEIKQKLFSKLAHEFKTPLLVIKSISQEMVEKNKDVNMSNLCNQISSISDYVGFLINDIIYYANYDQINFKMEDDIDIQALLKFSENICIALTSILFNSKKKV